MIKIGGFNIAFSEDNIYDFSKRLRRYATDEKTADLVISVTDADVEYEQHQNENQAIYEVLLYNAVFRKIAEWLPLNNAFLLHGALIDVDGTGVAFSAVSGTGKSTHMMLWQQLLGDKLKVVNGDKPLIRFVNDIPYAFCTPWKGKEKFGENIKSRLKHICFITRSQTNSTKPLSKTEALPRIMNQVYMPKDPAAIAATLQLINRLLDSVQLWEIRCNMELDAAKTAYSALFPDNAE